MSTETTPIFKLKDNVNYNLESIIPSPGWAAKFSNCEQPITLIGWAICKSHRDTERNGFNGSLVVGIISIPGHPIMPCDLLDTFKGYIEQTS